MACGGGGGNAGGEGDSGGCGEEGGSGGDAGGAGGLGGGGDGLKQTFQPAGRLFSSIAMLPDLHTIAPSKGITPTGPLVPQNLLPSSMRWSYPQFPYGSNSMLKYITSAGTAGRPATVHSSFP